MNQPTLTLLCALAVALANPTHAQTKPKQIVHVVDGDSLVIDNKDVRLWGIDSPELKQTCSDQEVGKVARAYLQYLVDAGPLRCTFKGRDRYGRALMLCLNRNNIDIGQAMVDAGWAWAYAQYTIDYVLNEIEARQRKRGVHLLNCDLPWHWRQHNGRGGKPVPPLK